MHCSLLDMH